MELHSLEGVGLSRLYEAFMAAFADYAVPIRWSAEEFALSNKRRGYDPSVSLAAFEEGRIVGFVLNGRGRWEGREAVYDLGTGVLAEARGSGLAGRLASRIIEDLPALGIERYVLEVIRENLPAYKTYLKAGFAVTRSLECHEGSFVDPGTPKPAGVTVRELGDGGAFPRDQARAMRDWRPAWQNDDAAIARAPELVRVFGAFEGDRLVGYLVGQGDGLIWQLAVAGPSRRRGVGTALVRALAAGRAGADGKAPRLRYINIQADDIASMALMDKAGAPRTVGQFEMTLEIKK